RGGPGGPGRPVAAEEALHQPVGALSSRARTSFLLLGAIGTLLAVPAAAWSAARAEQRPAGAVARRQAAPRAPGGGSLVAPSASEPGQPAGAERPQADPLVSNGLGSPACGSPLETELAADDRRDCETSGFTAAGAPTGNFGLDVHID